jgi:glutaredoxin 3
MAAQIRMYATRTCPYCIRAEALLNQKGVTDIDKILVDMHPERRAEMIEASGRRTVPQIFIDGVHVGGCDDLFALDHAGRLDALLSGQPG